MPDFGLLTMSETMDRVRHVVRRGDACPVVADMDTGYGNPLNVQRTVREVIAAGAAGIILEDQEWPKKCGHFEGKRVIPAEDHAAKLRAAADARDGDDLVIIARTDARAPLGLDEAIRRGKMYRDAGADVVFVEAPQSLDELQGGEGGDPGRRRCSRTWSRAARRRSSRIRSCRIWGTRWSSFPSAHCSPRRRRSKACMRSCSRRRRRPAVVDRLTPFHEFEKIVGVPELRAAETKYGVV